MANSNGRQTLVQRIALDGGEDIKKEFAALGKAGEQAFAQLKAAADKTNAGLGNKLATAVVEMRAKLQALNAAGGQLGSAFTNFTGAADRFGNAVATSAKKIALVTAAIGGAVAAAVLFAKSEAANSERIDNQSKSLGISAQAYQNFETAAKNAELEGASFDKILQKFIVNAADSGDASNKAADGAKNLANSIEQVAVKAEDGSDKIVTIIRGAGQLSQSITKVATSAGGGEKALIAFAKKITALGTAQERIQALLAAGFDKKTAAQTITFLRAVANDADDASRALSKTIGPLSDLQIAVGVDLDNAFDRLGTNLGRTKSVLATLFDPALTLAANLFADLIYENRDAIISFAEAIKNKALVIVADLIAVFLGADDRVQNTWILDIRDAIVNAGTVIKHVVLDIVVPAYKVIKSGAELVALALNKMFGTNFTGGGLLLTFVVLKLSGTIGILTAALGLSTAALNLFKAALLVTKAAVVILKDLIVFILEAIAAAAGIPVAAVLGIAIAVGIAAFLIYKHWDEIKAQSKILYADLKADVAGFVPAVKGHVDRIGSMFKNLAKGDIKSAFSDWVAEEKSIFGVMQETARLAVDELNIILAAIGVDGPATWQAISDAAAPVWESIKQGATDAGNAIASAFSGEAFQTFFEQNKQGFKDLWGEIQNGVTEAFKFIEDTVTGTIRVITSAINGLISLIKSAITAIASLASKQASSSPSGGGGGFASGGYVAGAGTGTSDSIPAWLSNGEFVIRAAAVKKFGASFFAMLNGLQMPKFNLGGLVDPFMQAAAPRFAAGGPVNFSAAAKAAQALHPVTLNIGGQMVQGFSGTKSAVQALTRRAGRAPSWVGA